MNILPVTKVNNYQTNFTSKFKFVSRKTLTGMVENLKTTHNLREFGTDGAEYCVLKDERLGYTRLAASNVIYGINRTKHNLGILGSFLYYPEIVDTHIRPDGGRKDHCFMIGGSTSGIDTYYKDIYNKCKDNNVMTTVFYGQSRWMNTSDVLYDRANDTVYVATSENIKNVEDLKNYYKTIVISKEDEVYINDEKVEL